MSFRGVAALDGSSSHAWDSSRRLDVLATVRAAVSRLRKIARRLVRPPGDPKADLASIIGTDEFSRTRRAASEMLLFVTEVLEERARQESVKLKADRTGLDRRYGSADWLEAEFLDYLHDVSKGSRMPWHTAAALLRQAYANAKLPQPSLTVRALSVRHRRFRRKHPRLDSEGWLRFEKLLNHAATSPRP